MVYGKQSMQAGANLLASRTGGPARLGSKPLTRLLGTIAIVLVLGSSAFAEFLVQPIILRQQVMPGRRNIRLDFRIENLSPDAVEEVTLRVADLTQDSGGVWMEVRPDDPNNKVDVATLRSCKDWLTCPIAKAQLDPHQVLPVSVLANIPAGTRGYYFAALIVETTPRETAIDGPYGGALLGMQYLVPIILESQNVVMQHKVELTDVGLTYIAPTIENPTAAVIGSMAIANTGGTYSRLMGQLRIWRQNQGHWTKAADLTLPENGIIPGVKLNLTQDIGVLLPNGKYKIEGYLYVDGRRANAINKEIDFVGDKRVPENAAGLVAIDLDKENLFIDALPGATRGGAIQVGNGSEDPITVNAEFILPPHMLNVVSGRGIKGEDIGCADWVTLDPPEFTLQRYGRRNVRVIAKMPATATQFSHYYGMVRLHVTYQDGTPGGMKTARVCVRNSKATDKDLIDPTSITTGALAPSRYLVTAGFRNGGVTHVTPRCLGVLSGAGDVKYKQFLMNSEANGQTGIFLPFETRTFSGTLDLSDIPAGFYRLTAIVEYRGLKPQAAGENLPQNQQVVEVFDQGGGHKGLRQAQLDQAPDGIRNRTIIKL
jgi:hypothetical protein